MIQSQGFLIDILRGFNPGNSLEQESPYKCEVIAARLSPQVAWLGGAHGEFNRQDVTDVYAHLKRLGFLAVIAHRSGHHRLPRGVPVIDPLLRELQVVDLSSIRNLSEGK